MPENKIITSKFFDANKVSEPNVISNEAAEQNTKIQKIKEDNFTKPQIMSKNKTFGETNSKVSVVHKMIFIVIEGKTEQNNL